ncbi:hypothetical protein BgiBS90_025810, partial [Biomphalaria glabrata]
FDTPLLLRIIGPIASTAAASLALYKLRNRYRKTTRHRIKIHKGWMEDNQETNEIG